VIALKWVKTADRFGLMIEQHLKEHFSRLEPEAEQYHPFIHGVYSSLAEYILRKGKRLASVYTLITYSGYRGDIDDAILSACTGIELYRHSILLHDDLVDGEDLRRGGRVFQELFESPDGRLGNGVAVFTGDISYALAVQKFFSSGFERSKVERAVDLLNEGFLRVNESQILDLLFGYKEPDVEEWYVMASKRAASLFKSTILIGAILGDAPEEDIPILSEAAENIGYSFDIQDDIIDTFTSKEQYGREPAGDILRRKKPLHIVYTLKMADNRTLKLLRSIGSKRRISGEELEAIRRGITICGALDAAKERSRFHAEKAQELMAQVKMTGEAKRFFNSLLTYVTDSLDWYK